MGTYAYEAVFEYSSEDSCWYAEFPQIEEAYADGGTVEEAARSACDALSLAVMGRLDAGEPLPAPLFHEPPLSVVCVEVTEEAIARSKCLTVSEAAELLEVSPGRVSQLLNSGQLEAFSYGNTRLVTIASVNARKANKPAAHRPRKAAAGH